jgi:hypothetical protein
MKDVACLDVRSKGARGSLDPVVQPVVGLEGSLPTLEDGGWRIVLAVLARKGAVAQRQTIGDEPGSRDLIHHAPGEIT